MGNKKSPEGETGAKPLKPKYNEEITLTFDPLQKRIIKAAARSVGISLPEWIRLCMTEISMELLDSMNERWHKDLLCNQKQIIEKFSSVNMRKRLLNTTDES
jgi:hypothetical protein